MNHIGLLFFILTAMSALFPYADNPEHGTLLPYLPFQDGYYIADYGETAGEVYSYAVYRLEKPAEAENDFRMYWKIAVLRENVVQAVLTVENEEHGAAFPSPTEMVWESDVNFDGKKDILLCLGHFGNQGALTYKCYLSVDGAFEACPSFTAIANPSIDTTDRAIRSQWRNSAASHGWGIYRCSGEEFILTEMLTVEASPDGIWGFKEEAFVNGQWITKRSCTEEDPGYENEYQKLFGTDSYWGID